MKTKMDGYIALLIVHIFGICIIVSLVSSNRMEKSVANFGADWKEVEVTIDDIAFYPDGYSEDDDGDITYHYEMERLIHYTYEGKEYECKDTADYDSTSSDYQVELRSGYTDEWTYKVNPENPAKYMKYYSSVDSDTFRQIEKILALFIIGVLVLIDICVAIRYFVKKRKVFDEE